MIRRHIERNVCLWLGLGADGCANALVALLDYRSFTDEGEIWARTKDSFPPKLY